MNYDSNFNKEFSSGASKAFNRVFMDYSDKVYQFCYFRVGNASCAEDLVEDIFSKVLENQTNFDESKASIKTWIFNIARNTVIDYLRSNKVVSELTETHSDDSCIASDANVQLNTELLYKALNQLSDSDRELIEMKYIQDLSYNEISEILNKSNGALRVSLNRSLNKLKHVFSDMGIDSSNIF